LILTQTKKGAFSAFPWYVNYIDVTDLVTNVTVHFPVNRFITLNEPVTLTLP
jgi:hypothetical protein